MAAGQDPEKVIAVLLQAKAKLGEAQQHTFAGLARLNKVRDSVQSALGRLGQGNPALAMLRTSEEAIKARAVEINALSARIDKAIAQVRHAASAGGAVDTGGPAPGPA